MNLKRGWLALAGIAVGVACAQDVGKNAAVKITARPRALTMPALYVGGPTMFHVRVYDIDIDGDGVADIEAWEGDRPGQLTDLLTWRAWFVNIAGRWYLADHGGEADCT